MGSWEKLDDAGKEDPDKAATGEPLTIDQTVDKMFTGINLKLVLVFISAVGSVYVTAAETYITIFTGFIPYTDWACVSDNCHRLQVQSNGSETFYSYNTMCDNNLKADTDFVWTSERTSFSIDWGFYCDTEAKLSVASSFFFIGACIGLLSSTAIFDRVGRRNGAIIGCVIAASATLAGTWIPVYEGMLAIRIFQGFGQFINFTGVYCWVVEFAPTTLRTSISALVLICWALGYLLTVLITYLIPVWNYIFLTLGILNFILIAPLLIYPISPRFSLVRGREEEAKRTLEAFSRICNNETSLATVNLAYISRVQNYWEQIKDFKKYPTMLKETLLCMLTWFVVANLFYGFSFGWGKISDNLYVSYLFAALGKVLAFSLTIPACRVMGRKKTMLFFLICGILSNFLAMPDVQINDKWTLEFVACLMGSIAISAAFAVIYIYTCELAPTSHRGMVMSLSSSCARVGSFIGTYTSLLYDITDRRVPLGMFAGATIVCGVAVFFLSDTTDRRIPETPHDVEVMSGNKKYQQVQDQKDCEL